MAGALIRLAGPGDAQGIAAVCRPFVTDTRITFEDAAPDAAEIERRMTGDGRGLYPWLVADEDGAILGFANCSAFRARPAYRWTVETGVYLAPAAQGRGVGRALLGELVNLLERQGYVAAVAGIALPNPASIALHERLGFVAGGSYHATGFKTGEWIDVGHWQRDLAPRGDPPAEPRPFAEFI